MNKELLPYGLRYHKVFLPPNMTDILQVLDLVVNAPIKKALRRFKIEEMVEAFDEWLDEVNEVIAKNRIETDKAKLLPYPKFTGSKPTVSKRIA